MTTVEPIKNLKHLRKIEKYLEQKSQRNLLLFTIGINCGLRISDIVALNVGDVRNKSHIQITEKKTGKFKKFPINRKLKPMFMITLGSGAEYDKSRPLVNIKEEDFGKSVPKDPYGYSKYMISKEIEERENILNLRIFGIYGVGEDPSRVTSCIINAKLKNEPVTLNQNVRFNFIWIEDFCKIVKHFVEHPTKEKFLNVAPNVSIEIVDLAKLLNVDVIVKNSGLNREYTADNTKLLKELGKFEFTSYKDGMKKFYLQNKNNLSI